MKLKKSNWESHQRSRTRRGKLGVQSDWRTHKGFYDWELKDTSESEKQAVKQRSRTRGVTKMMCGKWQQPVIREKRKGKGLAKVVAECSLKKLAEWNSLRYSPALHALRGRFNSPFLHAYRESWFTLPCISDSRGILCSKELATTSRKNVPTHGGWTNSIAFSVLCRILAQSMMKG